MSSPKSSPIFSLPIILALLGQVTPLQPQVLSPSSPELHITHSSPSSTQESLATLRHRSYLQPSKPCCHLYRVSHPRMVLETLSLSSLFCSPRRAAELLSTVHSAISTTSFIITCHPSPTAGTCRGHFQGLGCSPHGAVHLPLSRSVSSAPAWRCCMESEERGKSLLAYSNPSTWDPLVMLSFLSHPHNTLLLSQIITQASPSEDLGWEETASSSAKHYPVMQIQTVLS